MLLSSYVIQMRRNTVVVGFAIFGIDRLESRFVAYLPNRKCHSVCVCVWHWQCDWTEGTHIFSFKCKATLPSIIWYIIICNYWSGNENSHMESQSIVRMWAMNSERSGYSITSSSHNFCHFFAEQQQ